MQFNVMCQLCSKPWRGGHQPQHGTCREPDTFVYIEGHRHHHRLAAKSFSRFSRQTPRSTCTLTSLPKQSRCGHTWAHVCFAATPPRRVLCHTAFALLLTVVRAEVNSVWMKPSWCQPVGEGVCEMSTTTAEGTRSWCTSHIHTYTTPHSQALLRTRLSL